MKIVRIGLTNNSELSLLHEYCSIKATQPLLVQGFLAGKDEIEAGNFGQAKFSLKSLQECTFRVQNNIFSLTEKSGKTYALPCDKSGQAKPIFAVMLLQSPSGFINVSNNRLNRTSHGKLMLIADRDKLRLILCHSLDEYVQGVLHGEIPSTYQLEAIKAQAVCARTYALNPRVDHSSDFCNVCDSYLCCQCFLEKALPQNSPYLRAIQESAQEVLTYEDQPILALFSACAGGHTENYEDCFSDIKTKAFPPAAKPYLRGVSEAIKANTVYGKTNEGILKELWLNHEPITVDAWSKSFRWSITLTKEDIESNLHFNMQQLLKQDEFAPYIIPPQSNIFGEVLSFSVLERGVGGTAISLSIETTRGNWIVKKELAIRSLFKNKNLNLKRLSSARIFFEQTKNSQDNFSVNIRGLGSGHGVGLQQTGAQGWARTGKNYREILNHYYKNIKIEKV